jgi:hypothetical protein
MLTLKEWMELVDYRITEGSDYNLYSVDAYSLNSWSGTQDGYSMEVVFDTKTQVVYCVEACDYTNNRAYRLINPDYKAVENSTQAWDDTEWIDLEVDDDFIQKCLAIKAGEEYDTRVSVPLELDDSVMFEMMKLAHERDITFNELVTIALEEAIDQHHMLEDIPVPAIQKKRKKGKK